MIIKAKRPGHTAPAETCTRQLLRGRKIIVLLGLVLVGARVFFQGNIYTRTVSISEENTRDFDIATYDGGSTGLHRTSRPYPTQPDESSQQQSSNSGFLRSLFRKKTGPTLTEEDLDRFIIVPEYKLLFCYTEKVGCTMFNNMFRALRVATGNMTREEAEFQKDPKIAWWKNTPEHHNLNRKDLERMMEDPAWTKALFYRDPMTRFLSAYNSKCAVRENYGGHCDDVFKIEKPTFEKAYEMLVKTPRKVIGSGNEHFKLASKFCGGLGNNNNLDYYDFVQQLKKDTASHNIQLLLTKMGVPPPLKEMANECFVESRNCPPDWQFTLNETHHVTGSNRGNKLKDAFQTEERLRAAQNVYKSDYELFQIPLLSLDEIKQAGV